MESGLDEGASGAADEDDVLRGIRALQALIWAHPVAFQRAFSALVHEGREFARTPEGAELRGSLERSELTKPLVEQADAVLLLTPHSVYDLAALSRQSAVPRR